MPTYIMRFTKICMAPECVAPEYMAPDIGGESIYTVDNWEAEVEAESVVEALIPIISDTRCALNREGDTLSVAVTQWGARLAKAWEEEWHNRMEAQ